MGQVARSATPKSGRTQSPGTPTPPPGDHERGRGRATDDPPSAIRPRGTGLVRKEPHFTGFPRPGLHDWSGLVARLIDPWQIRRPNRLWRPPNHRADFAGV